MTAYRRLASPAAFAVALVFSGAFLRLANLAADPNYPEWVGYLTDEGRWVQAARNFALSGDVPQGVGRLHLVVAPLYEAVSFLVFSWFGVTLGTARLFSAATGCFLLVLFWLRMRRVVAPPALVLGLSLLTFQVDLIALTRLAIPELPVMLLELLVYVVLTSAPSGRGALLAGLFSFLTLSMKATSAPFLAVASAIILLTPWLTDHHACWRSRIRILVHYWLGVLVLPMLAMVGLLLLADTDVGWRDFYRTNRGVLGLLHFSRVYDAASFPFSGGFARTCNVWAMGLWIAAVSLVAQRGTQAGAAEIRHLAASAVWLAISVPIMLGLEYFPTRYKVHVLLPLAIQVTCGVSLFLRIGPSPIIEVFQTEARRFARMWRAALLVLPSGVLLAPVVLQVMLALASVDPERLLVRLSAIATSTAILWSGVYWRGSRRLVCWCLYVPVGLLMATSLEGVARMPYWPAGPDVLDAALRVAIAAAIGLVACNEQVVSRNRWMWGRIAVGTAAAVSVFALVREAPHYLSPTYTQRDASARLQVVFSDCEDIGALRTEGVFNGNTLLYESRRLESRPACLVTASASSATPLKPRDLLLTARESAQVRAEYELLETYWLSVSPEHCVGSPTLPENDCGVVFAAHVRRDAARGLATEP